MAMRVLLLGLVMAMLALRPATGQAQPLLPGLSATQDTLLAQIARHGGVFSEYIGRIAYPSAQYARFDSLQRISSAADLIVFTSHPSAAVKIYAFRALLKDNKWQPALAAFERSCQDTTVFDTRNGCIGNYATVNGFMQIHLRIFFYKHPVVMRRATRKAYERTQQQAMRYDEHRIVARQYDRLEALDDVRDQRDDW